MERTPLARQDPSVRKRKFSRSLGVCKPAAVRSEAVTASRTLASASGRVRLLEIKGGGPPTSCWQEEAIYSNLLFENLLGGKSHLIFLHKQLFLAHLR